jgi:hypothetical protein
MIRNCVKGGIEMTNEKPNTPVENRPDKASQENVEGETIHFTRAAAQNVQGTNVLVRQGGAQTIHGNEVVIRQGGAFKVTADHLETVAGGMGYVRTQTAALNASNIGVVVAGNDIQMDQSAARLVVSAGDISMDQGATVAIIANKISSENSSTVLLLANKVEGNVSAVFGPRESVLFGAVAGLVAGVVMLIGGRIKSNRKNR